MIFGALANTDQLKNVIKIIFNVLLTPWVMME